jgi:hypothetical protein
MDLFRENHGYQNNEPEGRIFSQAGNELGASSFPARNELSMLFPYTSFPAGNKLILKLTKNTASGHSHKGRGFDTPSLKRVKAILSLIHTHKIGIKK